MEFSGFRPNFARIKTFYARYLTLSTISKVFKFISCGSEGLVSFMSKRGVGVEMANFSRFSHNFARIIIFYARYLLNIQTEIFDIVKRTRARVP